ncbi:MAG: DNA-3-methyladenine glycosylase [archaeon]|nr:MAG: DNA-3-methyladenine glycosylase [archaeon]
MKLSRKFYVRKTDRVARNLLGCVLVHKTRSGRLSGKIVETEAYLGKNDPGSAGCRHIKSVPKILLGKGGHAFVYFTYGNHWMFNIVTETPGVPGAVLIRALEPVEGKDVMRKNRNNDNLTAGPGRLTQALGITKKQNGIDLTGNELYIITGEKPGKIVTTTRIGLSRGGDLKLRFYIRGNKFVSVI